MATLTGSITALKQAQFEAFKDALDGKGFPTKGYDAFIDGFNLGTLKEIQLSTTSYGLEVYSETDELVGTMTYGGAGFRTTGGIGDPYVLNEMLSATSALKSIRMTNADGDDLLVFKGNISLNAGIGSGKLNLTEIQVGSAGLGQMVDIKGNLTLTAKNGNGKGTRDNPLSGTLSGTISEMSVLVRQGDESYLLTVAGSLTPVGTFLQKYSLDSSSEVTSSGFDKVAGNITGLTLSHIDYADSVGHVISGTTTLFSATGLALTQLALRNVEEAIRNDLGPDFAFGSGGVVTNAGTVKGTEDWAEAVAVQADGKVLVAGLSNPTDDPATARFTVVRYNTDGTLDTKFNTTGKWVSTIGACNGVNGLTQLTNGNILVSGNHDGNFAVFCLKSTGALDLNYGVNGYAETPGAFGEHSAFSVLADDGRALVGGGNAVVRYTANGDLDTGFDGDGQAVLAGFDSIFSLAQKDGKTLVTGQKNGGLVIARLNADGTLDTTFNNTGYNNQAFVTTMSVGNAQHIAFDAAGNIIVACSPLNVSNTDVGLVRFKSNGTLDTSFGNNGTLMFDAGSFFGSKFSGDSVLSVSVGGDGNITVVGNANGFAYVAHVTSEGWVTGVDKGNPDLYANAAWNNADGSVYLAGSVTSDNHTDDFAVVKLVDSETALKSVLLGGNDVLTMLGDKNVDLDGYNGNDKLTSGSGNDTLKGGKGNDTLVSGAGNDRLDAGTGVDVVDGGVGSDTLELLGERADYGVIGRPSTVDLLFKNTATNENIKVRNVEYFQFSDGTVLSRSELMGNTVSKNDDSWVGPDAGLGGADTVNGLEGNDTLDGGDGNDTLYGSAGNDVLIGGLGSDSLVGGAGDDVYWVDDAGDKVDEALNGGTDRVETDCFTYALGANVENLSYTGEDDFEGVGQKLNNVLTGGAGNDTLAGMEGNDTLDGGAGEDSMNGGDGNDTYIVDNVDDVTTEDNGDVVGGIDLVKSSASQFALDNFIENLTLTGTDDISGYGNSLANVITGNSGNNLLYGGLGAVTVTDTLIGGAGDDTYFVDLKTTGSGKTAKAVLKAVVNELAGGGNDTLQLNGSASNEVATMLTLAATIENLDASMTGSTKLNLTGNAVANTLIGNEAANLIYGLAGADVLQGLAGNDTLDGGAGADTLYGGAGDDTYLVDNAADIVSESESGSDGTDLVKVGIATLKGSYTLTENVENGTLTNTVAFNLTGNGSDNILVGNAAANTLSGDIGNDTLDGLAGSDTLMGGAGDDTYVINVATDIVNETVDGSDGTDLVKVAFTATGSYSLTANVENATVISGATIAVNLAGNELDNVLTGNAAANVLSGGNGADSLIGGLGNDKLTGGEGADVFVFDSALNKLTNVDTITDFLSGTDTIELSAKIFTGFTVGESVSLGSLGDKLTYSSTTGILAYDADGAGVGAAVKFATLGTATSHPTLLATDIKIVA